MADRLKWRGPEVLKLVEKAEEAAINTTMAACIKQAKANHGEGAHDLAPPRFETQYGELERSIRILDKAGRDSKGAFGRWGSRGIVYALRIELGFQGQDSLGRAVDARPYPFLRPASQVEYPKLALRVKRAFGKQKRAVRADA